MTRAGGIFAATVVAMGLAIAPAQSQAPAPAAPAAKVTKPAKAPKRVYLTRAFDGQWSVVIDTAVGSCGSYRAALQIINGQVVSASSDYTVAGSVYSNGMTAVTVSSPVGNASGIGRLFGARGMGQWRSSGGECAGSWNAARRG